MWKMDDDADNAQNRNWIIRKCFKDIICIYIYSVASAYFNTSPTTSSFTLIFLFIKSIHESCIAMSECYPL